MLFYFTTWPVTSPKQLWTSSQMSPIYIGIQLVEIFMYKTCTPFDQLKAPVGLASNLTFYSIRGHKWTRSDDHFSITISDSLWFENVTTGLICIFDDDLFFISENISKTFIAPEAIEQPLSSLEYSFSNGKLPSNLDDNLILVITRKDTTKMKASWSSLQVLLSWSEEWWFEENQPIGPPYPIKPQYCIYGLLNRKPKLFSLIL